jgi:hypothetical protein
VYAYADGARTEGRNSITIVASIGMLPPRPKPTKNVSAQMVVYESQAPSMRPSELSVHARIYALGSLPKNAVMATVRLNAQRRPMMSTRMPHVNAPNVSPVENTAKMSP